jgi:hypothetical protein
MRVMGVLMVIAMILALAVMEGVLIIVQQETADMRQEEDRAAVAAVDTR